jgi:hypothetical protein
LVLIGRYLSHLRGVFFLKKEKDMKALKLVAPLDIYLVPREVPNANDTLKLILRREIDNEIKEPNFTFQIGQKLKLTITENTDYFKPNEKYEIELLNDNKIIYLGKLQTFTNETDIQNYEYKDQTNGRFGFK